MKIKRVSKQTWTALCIAIVAFLIVLYHNLSLFAQFQWQAQDWELWSGIAQSLHEYPMYETAATRDNKPPVLMAILYVFGFFEGSRPIFALSASVSIGLLTAMVYRTSATLRNDIAGILAAMLCLSGIYSIKMFSNGIRPWALLCGLTALYYAIHDRPMVAGGWLALGGLIWQFIGLLVVPLLVILPRESYKQFIGTTALVGVPILILPDLVINSRYGSVFSSVVITIEHITTTDFGIGEGLRIRSPGTHHRAFSENYVLWAKYLWKNGWQLIPLIATGLLSAIRNRALALASLLLLLPLFGNAHTTYFLLSIPFLSIGVTLFAPSAPQIQATLHNLYAGIPQQSTHEPEND